MIDQFYQFLNSFLGLELKEPTLFHMIFRSVIVYALGIILIKLDKRFIGEKTSFDTILKFIIGNALANGIVGNSPFFTTTGMVVFIVFFNWTLAKACYHSKKIEKLLKGNSESLYDNNNFHWKIMKKNLITKEDLLSELRKKTGLEKINSIIKAIFENSGEISFITNKAKQIQNQNDDLD